jgi:iron complex outermembrane receptor protein
LRGRFDNFGSRVDSQSFDYKEQFLYAQVRGARLAAVAIFVKRIYNQLGNEDHSSWLIRSWRGAMVKTTNRSIYISVALALGTSPAGWAAAEDVGADQPIDVLQEVTITAQRRTENLQTVPIAATAIQGSELQSRAVTQISDLQYAAPSLSIGTSGLTNSVNIRGVGLASGNPNVANGVATYYDGLFQPPIVTTNQFYDLADVEVLRGPQGTLVGSNSTGGAIFINTQNPKLSQTEGYADLSGGNYNTVGFQGAVNLPVGDVLAVRLAAETSQHESFYRSIGPTYNDAGSLYEKAARLGILYKPGNFQALAKIEYTDRNTGGYAVTAIPGTQYAPFAPADPFVIDYDSPSENHERGLISDVELRYSFDNGLTLRSLTGYQDKNIHNLLDQDGTAENTAANPQIFWDQRVREREWTEEINILSPQAENYNWVVGGYAQRNKIDVNIDAHGSTGPGGPTLFIYSPQNKMTTGWFGQLNFKITPQWELQTGLRYSTFRVDGNGFVSLELPSAACGFIGLPRAPWNGCQVADTGGDENDGRVTGKIALNYTLDDNNLLYAFVARGYKPGGFNAVNSNFGPETVLDYEVGWKSAMFANHIRTQLGGFYYSYHNFQFQELQLSSGNSGVTNLPTAKIDGIEASIQARVAQWEADGSASYVHSSLPSAGPFVNTHLLPPNAAAIPQCPAGVAPSAACFDYTPYLTVTSAGPNLYSPEWTLSGGVQYEFRLGGAATLTPRVNYSYVSGQYTSLTYSKVTDYLPAHGLLSALLTLQLTDNWMVEGYGTNLTDKLYRSGQGGNNGNYYFYGAPRQYGARVRYTF